MDSPWVNITFQQLYDEESNREWVWSRCAGRKAKRMVLQCINGVGYKSRRGKNKNLTALSCQIKNLTALTCQICVLPSTI